MAWGSHPGGHRAGLSGDGPRLWQPARTLRDLLSLPLAAIGGVAALVMTHHELDLSSLIGFLMLIGIVVTNAIVLLDLFKQLQAKG